jgi:hypothetical protein
LSFFTRTRQVPGQRLPAGEEELTAEPGAAPPPDDASPEPVTEAGDVTGTEESGAARGRVRLVLARTATVLAGLLVLFVLLYPGGAGQLTPAAFLRVPIEALVGLGLILVLPGRARRVAAIVIGVLLGVEGVLKIADVGFYAVLDRPFDPVADWAFIDAGYVYLVHSAGRAGAIGAAIGAVVLAVAVLALVTLSVVRLSRPAVRYRRPTASAALVLGAAWVACAVLGVQIVPNVPVAGDDFYNRALQVRNGIADEHEFADEEAVDAFRGVPPAQLLTALRGKDVIISFVESYGRVALENPQLAPEVGAVLDAGTRRLAADGFTAKSAFVTSPTTGGGSWLAQSTLLSGLWIDNQKRYTDLLQTDRLTVNGAFRSAGWRTVGVMPGVILDWPEGKFFTLDQIYAAKDLGYRGPSYSFATMPDQYTLSAFQRLERTPNHQPVMAEIPLISSHAPWSPIPQLRNWDDVGDGSTFDAGAGAGDPADIILRRDSTRVRADYGKAVEYSLNTLISYVETYGDDNLVLVFLGDHQPSKVVAGDHAPHDAPITIVARDPAVMDRVANWGWQDGLRPDPQAPTWRMDTFRDRFLTAFGPQP